MNGSTTGRQSYIRLRPAINYPAGFIAEKEKRAGLPVLKERDLFTFTIAPLFVSFPI
jgi:hypothetical protein